MVDPWYEVMNDVVDSLKPIADELSRIPNFPVPMVAFPLDGSDDLLAELAWPKRLPPVAVLTGNQIDYSDFWKQAGWTILDASLLVHQGISMLINQLGISLADSQFASGITRERNASSVNQAALTCHIAGVRFALGKVLPSSIFQVGDRLLLERESKLTTDTFAVRIMHDGKKVGYLPKPFSVTIAEKLDTGMSVGAEIKSINNANSDSGVLIAIIMSY